MYFSINCIINRFIVKQHLVNNINVLCMYHIWNLHYVLCIGKTIIIFIFKSLSISDMQTFTADLLVYLTFNIFHLDRTANLVCSTNSANISTDFVICRWILWYVDGFGDMPMDLAILGKIDFIFSMVKSEHP